MLFFQSLASGTKSWWPTLSLLYRFLYNSKQGEPHFLVVPCPGVISTFCFANATVNSKMAKACSQSVTYQLNMLAFYQTAWNLPTNIASTHTRHAQAGRPNLIRCLVNEESDVSSEDSLWLKNSTTNTNDDKWVRKALATRVIVEIEGTKTFLEKNCFCQQCHGPAACTMRTTYLVTNLMLTCRSPRCGYVSYGEAPAQVELEEESDKREHSMNYAIDILYVLGFNSCGDRCTEATRILGLLGLPNETTMIMRSFEIIEDQIRVC